MTTWEKYFSENDAIVEANKNWTGIDKIIEHGKTEDVCIDRLAKSPDLLLLTTSSESTFQIFHNVQQIGGTRLHPTTYVAALHRFGPDAVAVTLPKTLFKDLSYPIPKRKELYNATGNADDFFSLSTGEETFKGKHCIVLPSILAGVLAKTTSSLPADLLRPFGDILKAHDRKLLDDSQSALSHSAFKDLNAFLWGIHHGKVPPIDAILARQPFVLKWKSDLHLSCLSAPSSSYGQKLAVEGDTNQKGVDVTTTFAKEDDKNNNGIEKAMDTQMMVVCASSEEETVDVEATSESLAVGSKRKSCHTVGCDEHFATDKEQYNDPQPVAEAVTESNMIVCHFIGCNEEFSCVELAREHMKTGHKEKGFFKCPIHVDYPYSSWHRYRSHIQGEKRNGCPANVLYIKEADPGEVTKSNETKCHFAGCKKEFSCIECARRHMREDHTSSVEGFFSCPVDKGKKKGNHSDWREYRRHILGTKTKTSQPCLMNELYPYEEEEHRQGKESNQSNKKPCLFVGCEKEFANVSIARTHMTKAHKKGKFKCPACGKITEK